MAAATDASQGDLEGEWEESAAEPIEHVQNKEASSIYTP